MQEAEGQTIPTLKQQVADLEEEKATLVEKVGALENQMTYTQLALCDVYEQVIAVVSSGEV